MNWTDKLIVYPVWDDDNCTCEDGCDRCSPLYPDSLNLDDLAAVGLKPSDVYGICSHKALDEIPTGLVNLCNLHLMVPGNVSSLPDDMHSLTVCYVDYQQLTEFPAELADRLPHYSVIGNPMPEPKNGYRKLSDC